MKNRESKAFFCHNCCYAMGTRLNVFIAEPPSDGGFIFDEIVQEVGRIEAKLSRFSDRSDVYRINQNAGRQPVRIDAEMRDILLMCLDYYERTHHAFDITLPSRSTPASQERFSEYSGLSENIVFDAERLTVAFTNPHIHLDFGGFGKGYAIAKIESILKEKGVQNALVSFGESSVLAMGHHPYGNCWKIGIKNDLQPAQSACVFELTDQSLSTSGFQRRADGTIGFHIISPVTQRAVEATSTITVQSSDALKAEILSTALFASLDTDMDFLDHFSDCHIRRIDYSQDSFMEINTCGK
jgi:thiamine biosynthesis lipoprotein